MNRALVRPRAREDERLSKLMALVLRHRARALGLRVTREGFVLLDQVVPHLTTMSEGIVTSEAVEKVVGCSFHKNGQPRFEITSGRGGDRAWIRATRRHSIPGVVVRTGDKPSEFNGQDPEAGPTWGQLAEEQRRGLQADLRALAAERRMEDMMQAAAAGAGPTWAMLEEEQRKVSQAEARVVAAEQRVEDMMRVEAELQGQVEGLKQELEKGKRHVEVLEAWLRTAPRLPES